MVTCAPVAPRARGSADTRRYTCHALPAWSSRLISSAWDLERIPGKRRPRPPGDGSPRWGAPRWWWRPSDHGGHDGDADADRRAERAGALRLGLHRIPAGQHPQGPPPAAGSRTGSAAGHLRRRDGPVPPRVGAHPVSPPASRCWSPSGCSGPGRGRGAAHHADHQLGPARSRRAAIQSLFTGAWGLASVIGPVVGGLLTEHLGWRSVFWVNVPVGLLAVAMLRRAYRDPPRKETRRFELGGPALGALSMTLVLLALEPGALGVPAVLGLLLAAGLVTWAFVRQQRRSVDPSSRRCWATPLSGGAPRRPGHGRRALHAERLRAAVDDLPRQAHCPRRRRRARATPHRVGGGQLLRGEAPAPGWPPPQASAFLVAARGAALFGLLWHGAGDGWLYASLGLLGIGLGPRQHASSRPGPGSSGSSGAPSPAPSTPAGCWGQPGHRAREPARRVGPARVVMVVAIAVAGALAIGGSRPEPRPGIAPRWARPSWSEGGSGRSSQAPEHHRARVTGTRRRPAGLHPCGRSRGRQETVPISPTAPGTPQARWWRRRASSGPGRTPPAQLVVKRERARSRRCPSPSPPGGTEGRWLPPSSPAPGGGPSPRSWSDGSGPGGRRRRGRRGHLDGHRRPAPSALPPSLPAQLVASQVLDGASAGRARAGRGC